MNRQALDFYGEMSGEMRGYLRQYGWHFNKKACEWAVSKMAKKGANGKMLKIAPTSKSQTDELLGRYNITLENNVGYDANYVHNMIMADFYGSGITDEQHVAMMIKDIVDDADQADGFIMHRWYADMIRSGIPVFWEDLL